MSDRSNGFGESLSSGNITRTFKSTVKKETNRNTKNGLPIVCCDVNMQRIYLESTDDSKEYVDEK